MKMFYEIVRKESWVKIATACEDLKAAGSAHAEIFWVGGNIFVMVEDVPNNPKTFIAESLSGLFAFANANYSFFRKEDFKNI